MEMSAWVHATRHWVKYFRDGNAHINGMSCSIWTRTADTESTGMKIMSSWNMTEKFQHSLELKTVCCKRQCWLWDGYCTVCCSWVPHLLTGRQKWAHIGVPSESFLEGMGLIAMILYWTTPLVMTAGSRLATKNKDTKHGMASCNSWESLNKCPWLAKLWEIYLGKTRWAINCKPRINP